MAPESQANLAALLDLLDESDESERLMKGEILRELGRFDEAKTLFLTLESSELRDAGRRLIELCDQADARLRVLWS